MVLRKNISMLISKENEVYIKLNHLDQSVAAELNDFFTFEVPGFKYMPAYRSKQWDGKIRLYNIITGEIYYGLLPYIEEFCYARSIEYSLEEGVRKKRSMPRDLVEGFIKGLRPTINGNRIEVRDYQIDAISHALGSDRSLLISPTASGKSLIIYCLIRYYNMKGLKTLILVPTTSLVEQMYKDFEDYGWSSDTYCQKVYQGHDRKVTKDVVISTWQSLYKMPKKYFEDFGCVIGDEAHLFKAKSLTGIMTKLHLCKHRFGLTGTLDGCQTHQLVLEGLFGPLEKVVTTRELIEKKTLADLKIKCIILKHENIKLRMKYAEELEYIVTHKGRQDFVIDLLKHLKGNTLCLFQLVEKHGKPLHTAVEKIIIDRNIYFVYGGTNTNTREEIRALIENAKNSIVIASYGTFSTGINIRNIHNIVFSSPSKSKIRVLQSIGRGLRQSDTKDSVLIFDIADDLTFRNQSNFTLNHFQERIKIYNSEKFEYDISKVKLNQL